MITALPYLRCLFCLFYLLLTATVAAQEWIITLQPGDNPRYLGEKYLSDMSYWSQLQSLNKMTDETVADGQLRIPIAWIKPKLRPVAARVLDVRGKVQVTVQAETTPLRAGISLQAGNIIQTGPKSSALLEFADSSRLLLHADSRLLLSTLNIHAQHGTVDTLMDLQTGRVDTEVAPRKDSGARYQINTPSAATTVRGTRYRMSADNDESVSRIEVLEDEVAVSSAGDSVLVPENFGTLATTKKAPERPMALLPPPDVSLLPASIAQIEFDWPLLPGAAAYRVEIMSDVQSFKVFTFQNGKLVRQQESEGFRALLVSAILESTRFQGPTLPSGHYILRLRGINTQGLEGLNGVHNFRLLGNP